MKKTGSRFAVTLIALSTATLSGCSSDSDPLPTTPAPPEVVVNPPLSESIDFSLVDQTLESLVGNGYAGASLMVRYQDEIVYHKQVGLAEVESNDVLAEDAVYRIMSMTKPIVSLAAMQLVESGVISLDDPLSQWIPEFERVSVITSGVDEPLTTSTVTSQITIRDLLNHTAGFAYKFQGSAISQLYAAGDIEDGIVQAKPGVTVGSVTRELASYPLGIEPGSGWYYGLSHDVLGHVIELASGMTLKDYLEENVFRPLEMVDTNFTLNEEQVSRLAHVYMPSEQGLILVPESRTAVAGLWEADQAHSWATGLVTYYSGGAGLFSTTQDYMKFTAMLSDNFQYTNSNGEVVSLLSSDSDFLIPDSNAFYLDQFFSDFLLMYGHTFHNGLACYQDETSIYSDLLPEAGLGRCGWIGLLGSKFFVDKENELEYVFMTQQLFYTGAMQTEIEGAVYQSIFNN